jgi:glycosyltransferase involved in cell wall biosynthesis
VTDVGCQPRRGDIFDGPTDPKRSSRVEVPRLDIGNLVVQKLVSAALIVRNEENHIGACLRSIAGLVDEIIVADTGSSDNSREIAVAHGARVFDYVWHDDFAAARNHAIDQATGDWILYIDADERVRPYDRCVESELRVPGLCACTVRFYPRTGCTAYPEHRLFRRDPRIRFRSAIHETIMPDLNGIVAAERGWIESSQLTIDHLGYDGDQSHKAERNLRLLTKQVQIDPDRIYLWWHLGSVYRDLGRAADAEAAWTRGADVARRSSGRSPEIALCLIELIKLRLLRGEEALPLIGEAKALQPHNLLLRWIEARVLVAAGRYREALSVFERLGHVDPDLLLTDLSYDRRIFGAGAFAEMGHCAFRLGRYAESENWYRRAETLRAGLSRVPGEAATSAEPPDVRKCRTSLNNVLPRRQRGSEEPAELVRSLRLSDP